ncbi:SDR family NAD(P)-dependent oxidoreductase [Polaromonas sp. SM01]|uniref:SDR family NAD(P)-dependent oxidoreductase n=1 Tax=Polaromonas sp. SM01 TaxID=3085630 RepID=UPI0029815250|nr:SDR family NAD(P)-dependent oxidoreductase [Polaromonas sp. SM01]MDW5441477.1 SDR family NAD(P)-dependent oxidoreductase [Polaromonas sp. SM01]
MNQLDLQGQHAVVTGGASGIGLGIARRLIASGAQVTLWDRDEAGLRRAVAELGDQARAEIVDIAEPTAAREAAQRTAVVGGAIDILVNSAGLTGPNAPVVDYPLDDWSRVMQVNLTGLFLCCQAVLPGMLAQGYGRIVNIASVAGKEGNPNACAYSASKAGVIALTKTLGKELAQQGVVVNCVAPAAVETPLFAQMAQTHIDYMRSKIPMGRFGTIDEVAALVGWLCTRECSFSTGAVFDLSGGRATY